MIIKYRANYKELSITPVECSKETQLAVWICSNGNAYKANKGGAKINYFDTWQEARAWLSSKANQEVLSARLILHKATGKAGNIKGMKEPQNA